MAATISPSKTQNLPVVSKADEAKLMRVCAGLGINLIEITSLVKISDLPDVAAWGHSKCDHDKDEEFIYINPKTLRMPPDLIELILRHEILHAAGYDQVAGAKDQHLVNLVLDVAINFVLHEAYSMKMNKLSRRIYPKETIASPLALVQPHLLPLWISDPVINKLWSSIWQASPRTVPSPTGLYYELLLSVPQFREQLVAVILINPFGAREDETAQLRKRPTKKPDPNKPSTGAPDKPQSKFKPIAERIGKKLERELRSAVSRFWSQLKSELFEEDLGAGQQTETESIRQFLSQLTVMQQLDETSQTIITSLGGAPRMQVYPMRLTRLSQIHAAMGLHRIFPFYWNKTPEAKKPRLSIYLDTSPSMDGFVKHEVYVIEQLREFFPTTIFAFSGAVEEVDVDRVVKGKLPRGYSTSFDAVIEHFLKDRADECCVIFTDGESGVTSQNQQAFKESGRRLFAIYFSSYSDTVTSSLDDLAEQKMTLKI